MADNDKKKTPDSRKALGTVGECLPARRDGLPIKLPEEELVKLRFLQKLENDPDFQERFRKGCEEAKNGKGSRYSLEDLSEPKVVSMTELRRSFFRIVREVENRKTVYIIMRYGKPMARIIPLE